MDESRHLHDFEQSLHDFEQSTAARFIAVEASLAGFAEKMDSHFTEMMKLLINEFSTNFTPNPRFDTPTPNSTPDLPPITTYTTHKHSSKPPLPDIPFQNELSTNTTVEVDMFSPEFEKRISHSPEKEPVDESVVAAIETIELVEEEQTETEFGNLLGSGYFHCQFHLGREKLVIYPPHGPINYAHHRFDEMLKRARLFLIYPQHGPFSFALYVLDYLSFSVEKEVAIKVIAGKYAATVVEKAHTLLHGVEALMLFQEMVRQQFTVDVETTNIIVKDRLNHLLHVLSPHLLEQLDGVDVELPSLYRCIDNRIPRDYSTEAWKFETMHMGRGRFATVAEGRESLLVKLLRLLRLRHQFHVHRNVPEAKQHLEIMKWGLRHQFVECLKPAERPEMGGGDGVDHPARVFLRVSLFVFWILYKPTYGYTQVLQQQSPLSLVNEFQDANALIDRRFKDVTRLFNEYEKKARSGKEPEGRVIMNTTRDSVLLLNQTFRDDIIAGKHKFEDIASRSYDCSSATHGADLGPFGRGQMHIVDTDSGMHIIKRTRKKQEMLTEDAATARYDETDNRLHRCITLIDPSSSYILQLDVISKARHTAAQVFFVTITTEEISHKHLWKFGKFIVRIINSLDTFACPKAIAVVNCTTYQLVVWQALVDRGLFTRGLANEKNVTVYAPTSVYSWSVVINGVFDATTNAPSKTLIMVVRGAYITRLFEKCMRNKMSALVILVVIGRVTRTTPLGSLQSLLRTKVEVCEILKWCPVPGCDFTIKREIGCECFRVSCNYRSLSCGNCLEDAHQLVDGDICALEWQSAARFLRRVTATTIHVFREVPATRDTIILQYGLTVDCTSILGCNQVEQITSAEVTLALVSEHNFPIVTTTKTKHSSPSDMEAVLADALFQPHASITISCSGANGKYEEPAVKTLTEPTLEEVGRVGRKTLSKITSTARLGLASSNLGWNWVAGINSGWKKLYTQRPFPKFRCLIQTAGAHSSCAEFYPTLCSQADQLRDTVHGGDVIMMGPFGVEFYLAALVAHSASCGRNGSWGPLKVISVTWAVNGGDSYIRFCSVFVFYP